MTKEQLLKELEVINKQESEKLIETYYPQFKEYEGKCFKKQNHYSCPEKPSDYWFLYHKVVKITPKDVYNTGGQGVACRYKGWSFETCKYKRFNVDMNQIGYIHHIGEEISEEEFNSAFNKALSKLKKLP